MRLCVSLKPSQTLTHLRRIYPPQSLSLSRRDLREYLRRKADHDWEEEKRAQDAFLRLRVEKILTCATNH